ncbi:hypothetical protein GH714_009081 [Hevea brasiliensis]|uniref:Cyclic nucleotide-binding domain-containing protein n=1 Tax=Hevea brasiliensis TaxID=3981 RepID=A0A6A6LFB0_HEVBR|nr:hypothetical protein GH714_009081 [Hevea brasiliensis]
MGRFGSSRFARLLELAGTFYLLRDKKTAGIASAILRCQIVQMNSLIAGMLKTLPGLTGSSQATSHIIVIQVGSYFHLRYLQSTTKRLEVWKIQRSDTEKWMHHSQLPSGLKQSVRKYDQYRWLNAKGVDEEELIKSLPIDLQKKVKRHLRFYLLRQVPLFDEMDENMLDAICEGLMPALCTKGMFLVKEGDPVNQMLFIIRGHFDSYSADITKTRFFNLSTIGPGDFCGEELLT